MDEGKKKKKISSDTNTRLVGGQRRDFSRGEEGIEGRTIGKQG